MFDDPKRCLHQLEQALKETEEEESFREEPDWLLDAKALLGDETEVPIRNQANNYGRPVEETEPYPVYNDREMEESDALYVEPPKRKGAGGLVFLALLELIGIVLVAMWWIRWLM